MHYVYILCIFLISLGGLHTKDSLDRVHSVFGSQNREECRRALIEETCHLFLNRSRPPAEGGGEEELIIFLADPIQLDSTVPVPRLENRK